MTPPSPSCLCSAGRPKARVLVVDDEPSVARGLRLCMRGWEVHAAGSVDEAIALLGGGETFDLVLCDVMMPGKLGTELCRWIDAAHPDLRSRVVMMSGGVRDLRARNAIEESGVPLPGKPFDATEVLRMLGERARCVAA